MHVRRSATSPSGLCKKNVWASTFEKFSWASKVWKIFSIEKKESDGSRENVILILNNFPLPASRVETNTKMSKHQTLKTHFMLIWKRKTRKKIEKMKKVSHARGLIKAFIPRRTPSFLVDDSSSVSYNMYQPRFGQITVTQTYHTPQKKNSSLTVCAFFSRIEVLPKPNV